MAQRARREREKATRKQVEYPCGVATGLTEKERKEFFGKAAGVKVPLSGSIDENSEFAKNKLRLYEEEMNRKRNRQIKEKIRRFLRKLFSKN